MSENFRLILMGALLAAICALLWRRIRGFGQAVLHGGLGMAALLLVNGIGQSFGLHVGINLFTVAFAGLAGVPGIAALVIAGQIM